MSANIVSYLVLFAWPAVVLYLFVSRPPHQALIWCILAGQLVLPEVASLKIPMVPAIDKESVTVVSAALGCFFFATRTKYQPTRWGLTEVLLVAYLICPLFTPAFNSAPIIIGFRILPGVGYYDAASAMIVQILSLIPYFLGRRLLREAPHTEEILRTLVVAALIYSVPMLFEIRMSPQLHNWIYGVFQSSFVHEGRSGGFRPTVFMRNGLATAFFMLTGVIAAAAFWRARARIVPLASGWVVAYLMGILVLCKTAGALVYAICIVPVVRFLKPRRQVSFAVLLVSLALTYPILRAYDYFPTNRLVEIASELSEQRAASLKTRFDQEQQLLARASDRFFFGWGRFGRNRVYDDNGKDITLTDGRWIITMGTFGFIGFLAEFGLLALPVFQIARSFRQVRSLPERSMLAALVLIVSIGCIEQLPNDSLNPWMWLIAGALSGRAAALRSRRRTSIGAPVPAAANVA
jgi:hypothetical protein